MAMNLLTLKGHDVTSARRVLLGTVAMIPENVQDSMFLRPTPSELKKLLVLNVVGMKITDRGGTEEGNVPLVLVVGALIAFYRAGCPGLFDCTSYDDILSLAISWCWSQEDQVVANYILDEAFQSLSADKRKSLADRLADVNCDPEDVLAEGMLRKQQYCIRVAELYLPSINPDDFFLGRLGIEGM